LASGLLPPNPNAADSHRGQPSKTLVIELSTPTRRGNAIAGYWHQASGELPSREQPVSQIIPKLFTDPRGELVVQNKTFPSGTDAAAS
jgi:hypothetical protein